MGSVVNIDGELVLPEHAKVSVFDRGFLYGDSIYEVVRTYGGEPFELQSHLERLAHSARLVSMALPWDERRFIEEIHRTIEVADNVSEGRETYIRVIVSRGEGEIGLDPALAPTPKTFIIARPLTTPPRALYEHGIKVAVVGVERVSQAAIDPSAKTGNYLNNVLALKEARDGGAHEAVMLDALGRITEGSTSNVFVVVGGTIKTPPLDAGILEGVTRRTVLRVARELGLPVSEEHLWPRDLEAADECFITSTIREMLPVTTCDGLPIGDGSVGPITRLIQTAFRSASGSPLDGGGF